MPDGIGVYEQTQKADLMFSVEHYAPLVKRIAQHMIARMPANVQLDDMIQAGMIGLLEASQKYDATQGASFETYAGIRIRGAIIDEMRKGDWVPRSVHRNARRITETLSSLEARLGRDASSVEVAKAMGVSIDEYHEMSKDALCGRLFSVDEKFADSGSSYDIQAPLSSHFTVDPDQGFHNQQLKKSLAKAITDLPEREQLVLSLYYDEELNLKEIGQVLGISESRVSQIHSQAALKLRARMKDWLI